MGDPTKTIDTNPIQTNIDLFSKKENQAPTKAAYEVPQGGKFEDVFSKVDTSQYEDYMKYVETQSGENLELTRAEGQSLWRQAFNALAVQGLLGEIVGGTIQGAGSMGAMFTDILTKGQRENADFSNKLMDVGTDIQDWAHEVAPIYRKNPDKAFDVSDPGWWFEGVPSIMSSISMMIPARGATGALEYLSKLTGVANKVGKTTGFIAKAGTTAILMRNAENMRESAGVVASTYDNVLTSTKDLSDDEFRSLVSNTEVGKDFLATGKELNKENYARYAASQAGWKTYQTNSANIVFDFLQTASAMKLLSGATRNLNGANPLGVVDDAVLKAEAQLAGRAVKGQAANYAKKVLTTIGMGASEGVEELVNAIGTKEGERVGAEATGVKDDSTLLDRVSKYLSDEKTWEQGFWGFFGGVAFDKIMSIGDKNGKAAAAQKVREIQNRQVVLAEMAKTADQLENLKDTGKITEDQYNQAKSRLGKETAFRMGVDAARAGNTDRLIAMLQTNDLDESVANSLKLGDRSKLTKEDLAATKSELINSIRSAEKAVQTINRRLLNTEASDVTKSVIFNQGIEASFHANELQDDIQKLQQLETQLTTEDFSTKMQDVDFATSVEIAAKSVLSTKLVNTQLALGNDGESARIILEKIDQLQEEIKGMRESLGSKEYSLNEDEMRLVNTKAQIAAKEMDINLTNDFISKINSKPHIAKIDKVVEDTKKKAEKAKKAAKIKQVQDDAAAGLTAEALETKYEKEIDPEVKKEVKKKINEIKEAAKVTLPEPIIEEEVLPVEQKEEIPVLPPDPLPVQETNPVAPIETIEDTSIDFYQTLKSELDALSSEERAKARALASKDGLTQEEVNNSGFEGTIKEWLSNIAEMEKSANVGLPSTSNEEIEIPIEDEELEFTGEDETQLQIDEELLDILVANDMKLEEGSADIYLPGIHDAGSKGTIKAIPDQPGLYKVTDSVISDKFRILQNLNPGDEVELVVEKQGTSPNSWADAYIAIKVNGTKIGYLNNSNIFDKTIAKAIEDKQPEDFILRLQRNKAQTEIIRKFVDNNYGKRVVTKLGFKKHGTVIGSSRRRNPLEVLGSDWKFAYTGKGLVQRPELIVEGETERYQINTPGGFYNFDGNYELGGEYVLVPGFASTEGDMHSYVPLKLVRAKLKSDDVDILFKAVNRLTSLINKGAKLNNEEVNTIREQIKDLIAINTNNIVYNESDGSVREVPKPYFKIHSNRIEFLTGDQKRLVTIWYSDKVTQKPVIEVREFKVTKNSYQTEKELEADKGKVITQVRIDDTAEYNTRAEYARVLKEALSTKAYNVNYDKLANGETNARQLFEEGRLQADFGALYDHKGKFISNFWAKPLNNERVESNAKNGNLLFGVSSNSLAIKQGTAEPALPTQEERKIQIQNNETEEIDDLSHSIAPTGSGKGWDGIGEDWGNNPPKRKVVLNQPNANPIKTAKPIEVKVSEPNFEKVGEKLTTSTISVSELEQRILALQEGVVKKETHYEINGEKYQRVSHVLGSTFSGDSSLYENARIAGNSIDTIVRDFFLGKTPVNNNVMNDVAFTALLDRLTKIKETIESRDQKFLTNNIVVYDKSNRVAGEIDILAIGNDGSLSIYDIKSAKHSFYFRNKEGKIETVEVLGQKVKKYSSEYIKQWPSQDKTMLRSKKDQHELQQSSYATMLEGLLGVKVKEVAILPFWIKYEDNGFITSITPEPGIMLERHPEVVGLLEKAKDMPFAEEVVEEKKVPKTWQEEVEDLDLEDDNSLPLLVAGFESYEEGNSEVADKNLKRMFGDNVESDTNVAQLLSYKGEAAFGLFKNAAIHVYTKAPIGTEYHEAFHATMHLYLTLDERSKVLSEAKAKYGEKSNFTLEELLAEEFRMYAIARDAGLNPTSITGQIRIFFDKLIYWAKKFMGLNTDTSDLFKGIYSGYFNYQPTEKAKSYAKKLNLPMVVEDARNVFTKVELDEYVNWATMIVANELPALEGVTRDQIKANKAKYSLRKRVLKRLSEHQKRLISQGDNAAAEEVNRIGKYLSDKNHSLWNLVVDNVQRKLNFNISYDELNQTDFEGNVQLQKDWDDRAAYTKSGKESFDFDLKRIILTTPRLNSVIAEEVEGGVMRYTDLETNNPAKLPVPIDFNKVYPLLVENMSDAVSIEEMVARVKALSVAEPGLAYLAQKLEQPGETGNNIRAKWFANFHKPFLLSKHVEVETLSDGTLAIKADDSNKGYNYANKWIASVKNSFAENNQSNKGKDQHKYGGKTANEIKQRWEEVRKEKSFSLKAKGVAELAALVGIPITEGQILQVSTDLRLQQELETTGDGVLDKIFVENMDWIVNSIVASLNKKTNLLFTETNRINQMVKYVAPFDSNFTENSFYNTKGSMMFSMVKPNYHTEYFVLIERVLNPYTVYKEQAKLDLLNFIKDKLQDKSFAFSNSIFNYGDGQSLLTIKASEAVNFDLTKLTIEHLNMKYIQKIDYARIGDMKNINDGVGNEFSGLSTTDWDLHNIAHYIESVNNKNAAFIPIFVQSDSGNMFGYTRRRIPVNYENGIQLEKSPMGTALVNIVKSQLVKAEIAGKLLFTRVEDKGKGVKIKPKPLTNEQKNHLLVGIHYKNIAEEDITVDGELWYKAGDPITVDPKTGYPTGRVFSFDLMNFVDKTGKQRSLNEIERLKVFGVFDGSRINDEQVQQELKAYLVEFANNLIANQLSEYTKYKEIVNKSKIRKGKKQDAFAGKWTNFEHFVAEYALNTFVSYVDEAQMFMGTFEEYKNASDTNKRAKETTSPKQTYTTFNRGVSYRAIILKDIELNATALDLIVDQYKTQLAKQYPNWSQEKVNQKAELIRDKYSNINTADAQGYVTLSRYEKILKDTGRWNAAYAKLINKAKAGEELEVDEMDTLLQVLKPFYYGRQFDPVTGQVVSQQIKTSLLPLLPSMLKGTELGRLVEAFPDVEEIYFQSAVKVGQTYISRVTDENGKLVDDFVNKVAVHEYLNSNWGLQLDVPEHLKDAQNTLGVQIVKHIATNLSDERIYEFGSRKLNGTEWKKEFHETLVKNIQEDSDELLQELGVKFENNKPVLDAEGNFVIEDLTKIQQLLLDEVRDNGLPRQLEEALEIQYVDGQPIFTVPLSFGAVSNKYMSLLSSLFTNRVTRQKFPGGHVVLGSESLLNNVITDENLDITGIQFVDSVKDRIKDGDFKLAYRTIEDGKIAEAEVLLPAWSEDFFKSGQRIDINDIPEDLRTMIGYRIPTEAKYSTLVLKVVGFLPEAIGSTAVMPYEFVAQTGWDFDVDTVYLMQRTHKKVVNGKEAVDWIAEKLKISDKKLLSKQINIIKRKVKAEYGNVPEEVWDAYLEFSDQEFTLKVVDYDKAAPARTENRKQRNNRVFDLMYSILTNPYHYPEITTPGNFDDAKNLLRKQLELLGIDSGKINPYTRQGQDFFRNMNIAGRNLKGMAANANSSLAVMQNIGAEFRKDLGFKVVYDLNKYNEKELVEKFGVDNVVINGDTAEVNHYAIGKTPTGDLTNVNGDNILNHGAQMLAMVLDIVKEGFPLGVNMYTFNTYMAMLGTGIDIEYAGLFVRQAAVRLVSDKVNNSESILDSESGDEVYATGKDLTATLFHLMFKAGQITESQVKEAGYWNKAKNQIMSPKEISARFSGRKINPLVNYNPIQASFSVEELEQMLRYENKSYYSSRSYEDRISYVKSQLNILKTWETYIETGKAFSDAILALTTDKLGAGPNLNKTDNFLRQLDKLTSYKSYQIPVEKAAETPLPRVYAKNVNGQVTDVATAIYDNVESSSYSIFPAYYQYSNDRAVKTLDQLFITRNPNFLAVKSSLYNQLGLLPNDSNDKVMERFLSAIIYDSIFIEQVFDKTQFSRILGVNPDEIVHPTLDFDLLSAAQKVKYVQELARRTPSLNHLISSQVNLLNRLTPKLETDVVERRQMHTIEFDKPKTSDGIDDLLIEDFKALLTSENEYVRSMAEDLIVFDYLVSRQSYTSNSWNSFVPLDWYKNKDIFTKIRQAESEFSYSAVNLSKVADYFVRNNWSNPKVVPVVTSKFKYGENGEVLKDSEDNFVLRNGTVHWNKLLRKDRYISVPKEQLRRESDEVKNASYVLIKASDKSVLMKRVWLSTPGDNKILSDTKAKELTDAGENYEPYVYYYPVSKLGSKFGGLEFANESMFVDNNVDFSEEAYMQMLNTIDPVAADGELRARDNQELECGI